jgi:hypothetical protein
MEEALDHVVVAGFVQRLLDVGEESRLDGRWCGFTPAFCE